MQYRTPLAKMLHGQGVGSKARAVRNKLIKKAGLLILMIVVSALFCVWSRVRILQMGYEVNELQHEVDNLTTESNHLKLEVERLKSLGHLQKVAAEVLGMHAPSNEEIVFIKQKNIR